MMMNAISPRPTEQQLHIYEEKGRWYAYGRSAQIMRQLQTSYTKVKLFANHTHSTFLTDRVEVDFKSVVEKFTIILCSDTELILKCPKY